MADPRRRPLKAERPLIKELECRAVATRATAASVGWAHGSVEDLVLAHGRWYRPAATIRPAVGFSGVSDQVRNYPGAVYVEGYLINETGEVVAASWGAVDDQVVIGQHGDAYLGVPLREQFRRQVTRRSGAAAVLHGQEADHFRLLRTGLPPGGIAG